MSNLSEFSTRDYQIGLKQAWHKLTRIPLPDGTLSAPGVIVPTPSKITREIAFPAFNRGDVFYQNLKGETKRLVGQQVLIAEDDGLPVGNPFSVDTYSPLEPRRAWDWNAERLSGTDYTVESVVMLWDRTHYGITYNLTELEKLAPKGKRLLLACMNAFNGKMKPSWRIIMETIVCANTWAMAANCAEAFGVGKQTMHFATRLESEGAKTRFEKMFGMAAVFAKTVEQSSNTPASTDIARQAFAGEISRAANNVKVFQTGTNRDGTKRESRALNQVNDLVALFEQGGGIDRSAPGTRAAVLAAFTEYLSRNDNRKSTKPAFAMFQSSEFGEFANRKTEFANDLIEPEKFEALTARGKLALSYAN